MNRELKLRAWHPEERVMHYFDWQHPEEAITAGRLYSFADLEVMQFTGLYDSNGKEIYDGDIVKISSVLRERKFDARGEIDSIITNNESLLVVSWGGYCDGEYVQDVHTWLIGENIPLSDRIYEIKEANGEERFYGYQATWGKSKQKIEVVGNIYENPSMIEGCIDD